MRHFCLFLALLALLGPAAAGSSAPAATLSVKRLQNVRLLPPDGAAKAMVIYVSDRSGWSARDDAVAASLRKDGDVVLGVDLAADAEALDAADGVCLYVVGELTDLAQTAQRRLDIQTYLPPILVGTGEGATFAYAALADAPVNTLGGVAVAAGFENKLTLKLPFCPGATATKAQDGSYTYAFDRKMPEPATLFVDASRLDGVRSQASVEPDIAVEALDRTNCRADRRSCVFDCRRDRAVRQAAGARSAFDDDAEGDRGARFRRRRLARSRQDDRRMAVD